MQRILVELSAEHPTLPLAELTALVEDQGGRVLERDGAIVLAEAADAAPLARRLALAHTLSAHWWSTAPTPRAMLPPFSPVNLQDQSFAIRARRLEGAHPELPLSDTVRAAGAALSQSGKVDLERPQIDIRLFLSQEQAHVGALLAEIDRKGFEARHVKNRAHFAPVSIHPRYARALVNLARVRPGERVADPFCGTGGLLLEAGLAGARVFGSDLDPRMAEGTRLTLEKFGLRDATIETRDVGELPEFAGPLDVVVSDPPYGRSSTTNFEPMADLYERFFHAVKDALRPGGRLALISPSDTLRERAAKHFRLVESHDQRVHKSMVRHWGVFVRD